MTDITLEQRAAFDSWWHKKSPELVSGDWDDGRAIAQAAWEAALRLSAPPDRIVLWSRNVSPHWFFMAQLSKRPPMEGSPVYETMDPVVLQGSPEALRLSAGADWVLVPREPTEAMRTAHAMYGDTSDWWQAVIAAAPRHETGEVQP